MASFYPRQPLFFPLHSLLLQRPSRGAAPSIDWLNRQAEAAGILTASGLPLRFVPPHGSGMSYEERVWWLGEVETRPGNWHDVFNAMVWLAFPMTKAAINACHHQAISARRGEAKQDASVGQARGPLRDALTQFDECGVVLVSSELAVWRDVCAHRWRRVFWDERARFVETTRVFVFGHATYDLLRSPHLGLCGKAVFMHVGPEWFARSPEELQADVDTSLRQRFEGDLVAQLRPRDFRPLPLLGIPGVIPENGHPEYYDDTRQFRPLRLVVSQ